MFYNPKKIVLVIFSAALGAVMVIVGGEVMRRSQAYSAVNSTYENLGLFSDVLKKVQDYYVDPVDSGKLIDGAVKGMLETLDPHSAFMTRDQYKEMQAETKGAFGGLGIEITVKDGILTIVAPIEDTPAWRAGLQAGDKILEIDGNPTKPMTITDAVKRMRGKAGTKVTLSILREEWTDMKKFTLVREIIRIRTVKSRTLEPGYGYARVTQFNERTGDDLDNALTKLESERVGLKGLILDLRNNPGGLLEQAVKVADLFLDSGLIVYTDGRMTDQKRRYEAHKEGTHPYVSMIVLVNAGSASASEIVAGALQDQGRAIILGTQTFGKGSVQTIFGLDDGSGLRLTTGRYYTPKGRMIHAQGINPDIVVAATQIKGEPPLPEFREKDLEHHLGLEEKPLKKGRKEKQGSAPPEAPRGLQGEEKDVQLQQALDLLKTWAIFGHVAEKASVPAPLAGVSPTH